MTTYTEYAKEQICGDVLFTLAHCWIIVNDEIT